ncbi:MAG: hypothetical protein ACHBN1_22010 [Heteroscytonema crispum UTEX LB 1556]
MPKGRGYASSLLTRKLALAQQCPMTPDAWVGKPKAQHWRNNAP